MPAETSRKIMKHGTSGVVAIPIDYRRYHGLKPGARVRILYDGFLILIPEKAQPISKETRELIDRLLG